MLTRKFHIYIAMLVITLTVGCGGNNPVIWPDYEKPGNHGAGDSHRLSGLYTFYCDPVSGVIDIEPSRDVDLHLNALKFLEPPPYLYLTLESQPEFNGNIVDVDIGLRNPYIGLDQFTGFDVCGIVFTKGTETGFNDPDVIVAGDGDTRLLNPDGYTRWWNPSEFPHGNNVFSYIDGMIGTPDEDADYNCTINGYKYFADDLGINAPLFTLDPLKRGMFSAGQQNIRHYTIDLSGGLIFNYAVDACWKKPQGDPPHTVPDDFPSGANRPEAIFINVTEVQNTLYYVDGTYFIGGKLKLKIDVYDHFNSDLNQVSAESLVGLPFTTATTPIGGGDGYSTYELLFYGNDLTQNGEAELLITVQSEASGYGGILPGEPVCAYFKHTFNINPDAPLGWALTWGGDNNDYGGDVILDDTGNIFTLGVFRGTVDFDPGPGTELHTSSGNGSAFISKFNPNGDLQWVITWGGDDGTSARSIDMDDSGNIYVTGLFQGTTDFDPGPGTWVTSSKMQGRQLMFAWIYLTGRRTWMRSFFTPLLSPEHHP